MEQRSRAGRGQSARPPIRAPEGFLEEEGAVSGPGLVSRLSPRPSLATADDSQLAEAHRDHLLGWGLKKCDPPKWDF